MVQIVSTSFFIFLKSINVYLLVVELSEWVHKKWFYKYTYVLLGILLNECLNNNWTHLIPSTQRKVYDTELSPRGVSDRTRSSRGFATKWSPASTDPRSWGGKTSPCATTRPLSQNSHRPLTTTSLMRTLLAFPWSTTRTSKYIKHAIDFNSVRFGVHELLKTFSSLLMAFNQILVTMQVMHLHYLHCRKKL